MRAEITTSKTRGLIAYNIIILTLFSLNVDGNIFARALYKDLMLNYSKLVRPVTNSTERLTVKLGLRLSQLIGIDEKNQIMTTNVWLRQEWFDVYLAWNPDQYGGVDHLYVPADDIWKPDIVLYNNADGEFQVTLATKATIHSSGLVRWEPPAIYKSSCAIDVEFFPFDEQTCIMKFSSWTYVYSQVDLKHINQADVEGEVYIENAIDMDGYYASYIWDIMAVPANRNEIIYPCCTDVFPDVTFSVQIRRKTLFYTVNLIIPCVAISFLTILVFYLPSDSGEKVTLCISILLSLTVFFLVLSDLIPPTSLVIPLIGKYLLFTMILVTISIIVTVMVLNLHYRDVTTHVLSPWVRTLFIEKLPKYLLLERPKISKRRVLARKRSTRMSKISRMRDASLNGMNHPGTPISKLSFTDSMRMTNGGTTVEREQLLLQDQAERRPLSEFNLPGITDERGLDRALSNIRFITEHLKEEDVDRQVQEDWKYIAMVVDRLFLWLFTVVVTVGTISIFLRAPALYDKRKPLEVQGY